MLFSRRSYSARRRKLAREKWAQTQEEKEKEGMEKSF
jgi:hypothetical protein